MKRTNEQWKDYMYSSRVAVSDTLKFTSSNDPKDCVDPEHGILYAMHDAGRTGYGEHYSTMVMLKMPIMQPHRAESIVIMDSGDTIDGVTYLDPVGATCIFMNGKVRVRFLANHDNHYYFDFDPETNTISKIQPMTCSFDGQTYPLTASTAEKFLESRGMKDYNLYFDAREHLIDTSKPTLYNGAYYGCLSSGIMQPIVWKSVDGCHYELISVIPKIAKYECQMTICNGVFYALLRGAEGSNYYVSYDDGKTFKETGSRVPMSEAKPQILEYDGKVLIGHGVMDMLPNIMRNGRNCLRLLWGEGEDVSKYKEIFTIVDKYGIVCYDIIAYKGRLFMLWSNSELFPEKQQWGMVHGKDLIWYARIGDLDDYKEEK